MDDDEENVVLHAMGNSIIEAFGQADLSVTGALALLTSLAGTLIRSSAESELDRETLIDVAIRGLTRSARGGITLQ